MTDHTQVKGYKATQLESTANIVGLRTGSTGGHDFCHDLTSPVGTARSCHGEIMGHQFPDQPLISRPALGKSQIWKVRQETEWQSAFFFHLNCLRVIYCITSGIRLSVYSDISTPSRLGFKFTMSQQIFKNFSTYVQELTTQTWKVLKRDEKSFTCNSTWVHGDVPVSCVYGEKMLTITYDTRRGLVKP